MPLVSLGPQHREALQQLLAAFQSAGESSIPGYFAGWDWEHAQTVTALSDWSQGRGLQPGWVPCTTVFLEEEGTLVGLYNFRHHLTPQLRRYGGHVGYSVRPDHRGRGHATTLLTGAMDLARQRGHTALVLSCGPDNLASARVIQKCGGVLQERSFHQEHQREVLLWEVPL